MNLRERAAHDAKKILGDLNGAGTKFTLTTNNDNYPLTGSYGDIGYLLNIATGEAVEGRTIEAAFAISSLTAQTPDEPARGWGFECVDISGKKIKLYVVKYEPDKTIGVGRIKLAVNLNGK